MCSLEKRGRIWILELGGDEEHRLSPHVLDSINAAIDRVRSESSSGSALVTTSTGKFFSNGFDLAWARSGPASPTSADDRLKFMVEKHRSIITSLVSLPIPTIAAVTGHAAAGGFMLALAHDYIVMRRDRGFLYMSELDIGMTFTEYMMALIRAKSPSPAVLRDIVLRSRRFTAGEALDAGIIQASAADSGEAVAEAVRLAEDLAGRGWDGKTYASIRMSAFPELAESLGLVSSRERKMTSRL
ncbi:unnamed protein product [Victoria cruziana]